MSYVTSYYHIVFTTYRRQAVLTNEYISYLHGCINHIIKEKKCTPINVGAVQNHVHILLGLNPTVALSDLMREIKAKSSQWVRKSGYFPLFEKWGKEYGAFSLSASHKDAVYEYIENQPDHHKNLDLDSEFQRLVEKNGLRFYSWPEE